jgi:hypothetical protein
MQVLPLWLDAPLRRAVKDDRILTGLDRQARAAYENRLASLAPAKKEKTKKSA